MLSIFSEKSGKFIGLVPFILATKFCFSHYSPGGGFFLSYQGGHFPPGGGHFLPWGEHFLPWGGHFLPGKDISYLEIPFLPKEEISYQRRTFPTKGGHFLTGGGYSYQGEELSYHLGTFPARRGFN